MKITRLYGLCMIAWMGLMLWSYNEGAFHKLSKKLPPEERAAIEQRALDHLSESDQQFDPSAENVMEKARNTTDTLSWKLLSDVKLRSTAKELTENLEFSEDIRKREGKSVTITGYMFPLHAGEQHTDFLLSAYPPSCPYCLPGGPADLIEVTASEPLRFSFSPITLHGIFHIGGKETLQKGMF